MRSQSSFFLAVVALAVAIVALSSRSAEAQGFALNRYMPAPSSTEGFGLLSPAPPPHLTIDARLAIDYAYGSLAVSTTTVDGRERDGFLVENSFTTHFAVSMGLADFLGFWVGLPVTWVQSGTDLSTELPGLVPVEGPAAGDFTIGLRAKLVGERERPEEGIDVGLGLAAALLLPSGVPESLTGDGSVGFRAIATLALASSIITPIVNVGFAYRPESEYVPQGLTSPILARPGSELLFGVGAHLHLDPVRLEGELRGATTLTADQAFSGDAVPIEVLLGAHFDLGSGVTAGLAIDAGVTQGVGVPAVRILGTLGYALPLASDGDDEDEDEDIDTVSGGEDDDGDGIPNERDECPSEAEDADGHADDDGCPEEDADGDGNPDNDDFCPDQPETVNDYLDDDGCPDGATIDGSQIVTTEPILFGHRRARLDEGVEASLALVAELLNDDPDIALVQVEGHAAENEGNTDRSLRLSEARAEAVLEFLVDHGVDSARLTFVGMGSDVPATEGAHDENRRVTFRILERR
jgi:outer membrane protein OmpA-like peptidoglycan-associated protein